MYNFYFRNSKLNTKIRKTEADEFAFIDSNAVYNKIPIVLNKYETKKTIHIN